MSHTPREVGTLVVVILKARNLPNKRHIGKQDPYCSVVYNNEKRRTKAIRRGGQHPEWDEEVRFTLFEDVEDELARTAHGDDSPPPPPPKDSTKPKNVKGGKAMTIYCYADDPREPDLIGEATVDLSEVLTKGETDEWFTLMNKDRYSGEVYLELTFWSNAEPPKKKTASKTVVNNRQYGGAGSFVPAGEIPASLISSGGQQFPSSRVASMSIVPDRQRQESFLSTMRPSSSLAQLDLYAPPYESRHRTQSDVDQMAHEFAEFGLEGHRGRSESFPMANGYSRRPSSLESHSTYSDVRPWNDDRPVTPPTPRHSNSYLTHGPPLSSGFQPRFEGGYHPYPVSSNHTGPRYGIPNGSSGFMPISASGPSGFMPLPSRTPEPFAPLLSQTPAPVNYLPSSSSTPVPSGFMPLPRHTPAPSGFIPSMPTSPSVGFHPSYLQSSFQYPSYIPAPPATAPPQDYPPSTPISVPLSSQSAPPEQYQGYAPSAPSAPSSPPHDHVTLQPPPPPPPQSNHPTGQSAGSRPLPQPQGPPHPISRQSSLPIPPGPPGNASQRIGGIVFPSLVGLNVPPPPPLPGQESDGQFNQQSPLPSPGAPPLSSSFSDLVPSPSGRPSLPQPPGASQQSSLFASVPPPPPLPSPPGQSRPPPPTVHVNPTQAPYPGPPPRPPIQMNGHSQWKSAYSSQSPQAEYQSAPAWTHQ